MEVTVEIFAILYNENPVYNKHDSDGKLRFRYRWLGIPHATRRDGHTYSPMLVFTVDGNRCNQWHVLEKKNKKVKVFRMQLPG